MKITCCTLLLILSCFFRTCVKAEEKMVFRSLEEIYAYADDHGQTIRNAAHQNVLAKYQTLAAKWNQFNLQISIGNYVQVVTSAKPLLEILKECCLFLDFSAKLRSIIGLLKSIR